MKSHAKVGPAVKGRERAEARAGELAAEQAALRKVATLVARETSPEQLFAVVAEQVARIVDVPHVRLVRFEADGSVAVGGFSDGDVGPFPIGSRLALDSPGATATVRQTGRPARVEDYAQLTGEIASVVRDAGMHAPGRGSRLVGLQDRVEALGGTIRIDSPAAGGTTHAVTLPIATEPDRELEPSLPPRQRPASSASAMSGPSR